MQSTYYHIQSLLQNGLEEKLGIDSSKITYESEENPGPQSPGFTTSGTQETITIPDEYMNKASASNSAEFLNWLQSQ